MKFKIIYEHEVINTYEAIIEAETEEEAEEKLYHGDTISDEEVDSQGIEIRPLEFEVISE